MSPRAAPAETCVSLWLSTEPDFRPCAVGAVGEDEHRRHSHGARGPAQRRRPEAGPDAGAAAERTQRRRQGLTSRCSSICKVRQESGGIKPVAMGRADEQSAAMRMWVVRTQAGVKARCGGCYMLMLGSLATLRSTVRTLANNWPATDCYFAWVPVTMSPVACAGHAAAVVVLCLC